MQRQVRSRMMIVVEVRSKNPQQVPFVENDDMIEALSTDGTDQPLNEWILPRRPIGDDDFLDAHMLDPPAEESAVDGVAIADQESRSMILGKTPRRLVEPSTGPLDAQWR